MYKINLDTGDLVKVADPTNEEIQSAIDQLTVNADAAHAQAKEFEKLAAEKYAEETDSRAKITELEALL